MTPCVFCGLTAGDASAEDVLSARTQAAPTRCGRHGRAPGRVRDGMQIDLT